MKQIVFDNNFYKLSTLEKAFFISKCGDYVDMKINCNETLVLYAMGMKFYELSFCNVTNRVIFVQEVTVEKAFENYIDAIAISNFL